ncbi:RNaseH domain-containing protein [Allosalinactinospora lopnorensis]|uniref:RNaseH domain-containing protein n=1 Tax=Allosalinactinospora lopnorensis TaxID=1352348 RepID=UPI000AC3DF7F|nr:RNaseH domain-containing protein [Allosalinactinospora lopnorensis]
MLGPAESSLTPEEDTLIGAWCETEMPDAEDFPDWDPQQLDAVDAKPQTKSILARRDIASQYLKGYDSDGVITPQAEDHPAQMALLDLFRSLGATDERIANAVEGTSTFAVEKLAHIGVHVRQQNRRPGERGEPKVVITATALVPPHTASRTWSLLGWSSTDPVWKPYHAAQNAFHASNYPPPSVGEKSYRAKWDEAAQTVEQALTDFVDVQDGLPYTVTVDSNAARRMWDGLQNMRLGTQPAHTGSSDRGSRLRLPGERLGTDAPVAVIRLNTDDKEVPRPIGVIHRGKRPGATPVDQETSTLLFEIDTDFGTPAWLLSNVPRNYDGNSGSGRRLGSKRTRWEVNRSVYSDEPAQRRKGEMSQNFYGMTATEILPIGGPSDQAREALAAMTARLCHQTMFWSDRARYPVPLHAAQQMDDDHPQHRREALQDEQ